MKLLYLILVIGILFVSLPGTEAACRATNCKCFGIPNGLFCGDGAFNCRKGNVYQCGENGQASCDYGRRNSCVQCNKLSC